MNIIEKYIETNKSLLDELVANDPTLGVGVIDALAVLNNYINANNVEFTQEEEDKILVPANIEEIKREQERAENELKLAEEQSKEIQQAVQNIDDLTKALCTYLWVRDWLGNKINYYFVLGMSEDSEANSIWFGTYLKGDVFSNNPTPANKLAREVFISKKRLEYYTHGVWMWHLTDKTIKSPQVRNLSSYTNKVIEISDKIKASFEPTLLLKEGDANAVKLLTQSTDRVTIGSRNLIFDDIKAQDPIKVNLALNTLQLVAWAEGIDLDMTSTTDFFELASFFNDAIVESKRESDRVYLVLVRDTLTEKTEFAIIVGSTLAEQIVQKKGENNAFVVGILVDGAFQNDIDPYMFSQSVAQSTTAQTPPTQAVQSAVSEDDLPILEDEDITIDIDDLNDLEDLEDLEDLDLSDLDFEINEQE